MTDQELKKFIEIVNEVFPTTEEVIKSIGKVNSSHHDFCTLAESDHYLSVRLPSGQIIPNQTAIQVNQTYEDEGLAEVTLTLKVKIDGE